MTDEQFAIISKKLTLIAALLLRTDDKTESNAELIKLLNNFDTSNAEIGMLIGMKPSAVAMAQSRLKRDK